jgi:hypothetical protein
MIHILYYILTKSNYYALGIAKDSDSRLLQEVGNLVVEEKNSENLQKILIFFFYYCLCINVQII